MRRDPKKNQPISDKSTLYVCQDHFDIENDMENFMRHKLQRVKPMLKKHVVPHIFDCQKKFVKPPALSTVRVQKRKEMVNELIQSSGDVAAPDAFMDIPVPIADLDVSVHLHIPPVPMSLSKSTQVNPKRKGFKSRGTNPIKTPKLADKACSTSEFDSDPVKKNAQSQEESEDSEANSPVETSDEEYVLPTDSENDLELDEESQREWLKDTMRKCFLLSIEKNPKLFLGLPPQCYLTITFLSKKNEDMMDTEDSHHCREPLSRF
ncbi:hypothetical protein JTE90_015481 [Oedothorax gibbosus]|uniref:THAP-type domain-containing protein n=1 Tax=Oedothorax gibbosus TaxID=931172 RepID=A0AAV6TFN6_9ARAC|nr:hypothetical protein JTE90_015481 [Oedothorax gibbosus]